MISKCERDYYIKAIINDLSRYLYTLDTDGFLIFDRTKTELAKTLEVSPGTLNKYLKVYAKHKNSLFKFPKSTKNPPSPKIEPQPIPQAKKVSDPQLLELLAQFKTSYIEHKTANNLSSRTINNINLVLDRFYDYVAGEIDESKPLLLKDIDKYFIVAYLNSLTEQSISKTTQKLHLTIITNFINDIASSDLEKYGSLRANIAGIKIKTEQKEKVGFSQAEQAQLISYIKLLDLHKTQTSQRNSLVLKILLNTGLRISELIGIKWSDITEYDDETHGLIYVILVKGKGNKERFAYISYADIVDNLKFLDKKRQVGEVFLFTTPHGNQCSSANLFVTVKKILHKAGIEKSGLHIFRHTFARNLVSKNVNLSTIKDLLGHSNITVTAQFYAKSDEQAKKNAIFSITK